ncbi:MAG: Chemotaxis protein LafU [Gemmatimonadaceae bacterium]|nr:Chemotaxis protein LafU [Gemmatimonadaceae bacterium]
MGKPGGSRIIIVKKRKKAAHGHHGGSWKVAYADFVTAMMAFFMVMWILGMDENLRKAIEGYFSNPVGFKKGYSAGASPLSAGASPASIKRDAIELASRKIQTAKFSDVGEHIKQRIDSLTLAGGLRARIEVTIGKDGLRIELIEDANGETFFPFGSARMKPAGQLALSIISQELLLLENPVIIEGHTDAAPYSRDDYTNWELSADRANAARRIMIQDKLPGHRIVEVNGLADRQLKYPDDPLNPSNRRISIRLPFVVPPETPSIERLGEKLSPAPAPTSTS